jgi:hypothetical protein
MPKASSKVSHFLELRPENLAIGEFGRNQAPVESEAWRREIGRYIQVIAWQHATLSPSDLRA